MTPPVGSRSWKTRGYGERGSASLQWHHGRASPLVKTLQEAYSCLFIINIIIYLFQAAQLISQHNIHIEGKKRNEKNTKTPCAKNH